jgi:hypothetical protein
VRPEIVHVCQFYRRGKAGLPPGRQAKAKLKHAPRLQTPTICGINFSWSRANPWLSKGAKKPVTVRPKIFWQWFQALGAAARRGFR